VHPLEPQSASFSLPSETLYHELVKSPRMAIVLIRCSIVTVRIGMK